MSTHEAKETIFVKKMCENLEGRSLNYPSWLYLNGYGWRRLQSVPVGNSIPPFLKPWKEIYRKVKKDFEKSLANHFLIWSVYGYGYVHVS